MTTNYLNEYNRVSLAITEKRETELTDEQLRGLNEQLIKHSELYRSCFLRGVTVREQKSYPYIFYKPLSKVLIIVEEGGYPKVRIGPCTQLLEFDTQDSDTHFGIQFSTEDETMGYALPLKTGGQVISRWKEK